MSAPASRSAAGVTLTVSAVLVLGSLSVPALAQEASTPVELQVLGINDFHGHLDPGSGDAPSVAGVLGGAVASYRAQNPNTVFVSAGDNIGASPFLSSSQRDAPTIEALDAMGLAVSAVGNHEFDRGYDDLSGRVDALADFPILGANVVGEEPALPEHAVVETPSGVSIGFVGVVTQQTSSLVSPSGIAGITFSDPVEAANRVAAELSDGEAGNGEADVVVLLAHEGAEDAAATPTSCAALADRQDAFGEIVRDVSADVDAILGGHTHVTVDCETVLPGGQVRPVLEASEYGRALARLQLTWDPATRRVTAASGEVVSLTTPRTTPPSPPPFDPDPAVEAIVEQAEEAADVVGREVIGRITADIPRARTDAGAEDRGSESLLGNFIADVQLSAVDGPDEGGAQIAFMNPGGLRADLLRENTDAGEEVGEITYAEAAVVQPFANTLFTLTLTGAQVEQVLEEQYQPEGSSRPFLALGVSDGLRYRFDDDAPRGSRIFDVTLDGRPLDPTATYRVVTNSFLASGGDNFATLATGTDRRDTGLDDLSVLVGYFRENSPVTPSTTDRAVPGTAPTAPTTPTTPTTPTAPGGGVGVVGTPVPDVAGTKRLAGGDRYATAVAVSQDSFPTGPVPVAFVVTGVDPADALAAGPVADLLGGPVLPVAADGIPAVVRSELARLAPRRIVVLGGTSAVSETVATELQGLTSGTVTRLEGPDRYATAARTATAAFTAPVPRVLIATGAGFADALAAGAVGAKTDSPVLLVGPDHLPATAAEALRTLRPRDITVVGGPDAVSADVLAQLRGFAVGGGVDRLAGPDRYATAARLAQVFWPQTSSVVYLATGRDFPDALAGVPAAGLDQAPLLLVEPTCMPAVTERELDRLRPTTTVVLGETAAVSEAAASGTVCG